MRKGGKRLLFGYICMGLIGFYLTYWILGFVWRIFSLITRYWI